MNKDQFLNTGLLEQYALGLTDENENLEVEKYLNAFPELKKEVDEIRNAVEQYAIQQAIPPHPRVKANIMAGIDELQGSKPSGGRAGSSNNWMKALLILGFAGIFGLLFLYTQKNAQNQDLKREFAELQIACDQQNERIQANQLEFLFMKHRYTQKVILASSNPSSHTKAVAFWNPNEKKGLVSLGSLPELPEDQQYQIWADVDHVMISVGLLENDYDGLQDIAYLAEAESLNITIEPLGGSTAPTVEKLVVSGLL